MLQIFIKDIFPQNNNFPYFHFYNEKLYSFVGYFLFSYYFLDENWCFTKQISTLYIIIKKAGFFIFPPFLLFFRNVVSSHCCTKDSNNLVKLLTNIRTEIANNIIPNNLRNTYTNAFPKTFSTKNA